MMGKMGRKAIKAGFCGGIQVWQRGELGENEIPSILTTKGLLLFT